MEVVIAWCLHHFLEEACLVLFVTQRAQTNGTVLFLHCGVCLDVVELLGKETSREEGSGSKPLLYEEKNYLDEEARDPENAKSLRWYLSSEVVGAPSKVELMI